jgi:hypothetical protein
MTTTKPDIRARIDEALTQLRKTHQSITHEQRELAIGLTALKDPLAQKALNPEYRQSREAALTADALGRVRKPIVEAKALAASLNELRAELFRPERIFDDARFVSNPIPKPPAYQGAFTDSLEAKEHKQVEREWLTCELLSELVEQTTRTRWQTQLKESDANELARVANRAAVERNVALLDVVRREVSARKFDKAEEAAHAKTAVARAMETIPLPDDLAALEPAFAEVENLNRRIEEAYHVIRTGDEADGRVTESADRIRELFTERGDEIDAAREFARERVQEKTALKEAGSERAKAEVNRAARVSQDA